MEFSAAGSSGLDDHPLAENPPPEFVDWLLGALVALAGLFSVVGGTAVVALVDRDVLAEGIREETITVTVMTAELTEAEMIELAAAVVTWTGIGLLVTGVGLVAFAVWYVWARHRAHRRARAGEAISSYISFAVLGAVITVVLSFLPVSPIFGGALAGYLERGESGRTVSVGALAGLLPALPILVLLVFVLGGVISGMLAIGQAGVAAVIAATLLLSMLLLATISAGLGALGGYAGGWIAERRAARE